MKPEGFKHLSLYLEKQDLTKVSLSSEENEKHDLTEPQIRTIISRYYYYIFLKIREDLIDAIAMKIKELEEKSKRSREEDEFLEDLKWLKEKITPPKELKYEEKVNVHSLIRSFLAEFSNESIDQAFKRLREYRNLSDYYLDTPAEKQIGKNEKLCLNFIPEELSLITEELKKIEKWVSGYQVYTSMKRKDIKEKIANLRVVR